MFRDYILTSAVQTQVLTHVQYQIYKSDYCWKHFKLVFSTFLTIYIFIDLCSRNVHELLETTQSVRDIHSEIIQLPLPPFLRSSFLRSEAPL